MILRAHGIAVPLPAGWDGRIRWALDAATVSPPALHLPGVEVPTGGTTNTVTHLANFRLPERRGDYGSGAVESMRARHVFASLVEFDPEAAATPLFSTVGVPRIRGTRFAPSAMQRVMPRMSGAQWFFSAAGRAFCLYAVLGSHAMRRALAGQLDVVMRGVTIAPR